jgi:hypothetical protein
VVGEVGKRLEERRENDLDGQTGRSHHDLNGI